MTELYGIAAEFDDPQALVDTARTLYERGFRNMEAYTPYPLHQLEPWIGSRKKLPPLVFFGGILGTLTAWAMQFYIAVYDYPINVGGRPLNSWPSFIVIMFELTILFASIAAFFGALILAGYPLLHHPIFNLPRFREASSHRFFLCVEADDPLFDAETVAGLLAECEPLEVSEVEAD